jgi:rare lipoprotein A
MIARAKGASFAVLTFALVAAAPHARAAGQDKNGWAQSGEATYYSNAFRGRRTSSGERYDPRRLTAAHSTLPVGTLIRVTRDDTGESVVVQINDHEPPHGVRIIDLSRAAAARLGLLYDGVASVTLTKADPAENEDDPVEVAEAPDDTPVVTPRRYYPRRTRHGHR